MRLKVLVSRDLKKGLWIKRRKNSINLSFVGVREGQWYKVKWVSKKGRQFKVYGSSFPFSALRNWRVVNKKALWCCED